METLIIIGGGLAGSEAAWQAASRGINVRLFEMRPVRLTEAHTTGLFAELVCSNSLRSADSHSAPGLLKAELKAAGSLVMQAAETSAVAAGSALAVDRQRFAEFITRALTEHPLIETVREECSSLPETPAIIATGPLTSHVLIQALTTLIGQDRLFFYDAIAPIIEAESIDYTKVYRSSRYGKGGDDYINCPMTREEYERFYDALMQADKATPRDFEEKRVFEGCMPIEVMACRGKDTPRFGPMKPVGLPDPSTGKEPYAVVQLRAENLEKSAYNMVGFQTRLKQAEQKRVFRMIPGLEQAEFLRYGSLHRNTFINSPISLNDDLSLKINPGLFMAGQITGVEGYIESTAMGMIAGINASRILLQKKPVTVPRATAHGSLIHHITCSDAAHFQPSNIHFGLLPGPEETPRIRDKKKKRAMIVENALREWQAYLGLISSEQP